MYIFHDTLDPLVVVGSCTITHYTRLKLILLGLHVPMGLKWVKRPYASWKYSLTDD